MERFTNVICVGVYGVITFGNRRGFEVSNGVHVAVQHIGIRRKSMIETIMAVTSHIRASIGVSERIIAKLHRT